MSERKEEQHEKREKIRENTRKHEKARESTRQHETTRDGTRRHETARDNTRQLHAPSMLRSQRAKGPLPQGGMAARRRRFRGHDMIAPPRVSLTRVSVEAQRCFTGRVARSIAHEITNPGFHHTFAVQNFSHRVEQRSGHAPRAMKRSAESRVVGAFVIAVFL